MSERLDEIEARVSRGDYDSACGGDIVELLDLLKEARWGYKSLEGNLDKVKQDREAQVQIINALRERTDHLAEENEAQHHNIRMLEATIENAVNIFKDFAAHNDADSIGNPVLWNSVLSALTGSDKP